MPSVGDSAPPITATEATTDQASFDLDTHLGDGPVVLAFFPGAYTGTCTHELTDLQSRLDAFHAADATVIGVSADSPFTLAAFSDDYGIEFRLVSDMARDAITEYDLEIDLPTLGLYGVPNRAIYVLDEAGTVTYRWVADHPDNLPDYDAVLEAVDTA